MTKKSNAAEVIDVIEESENTAVTEVAEVKVDDKGRKTEVQMSIEELEGLGLKSKSAVMRHLAGQNYSTSAIAKFLGVRYQFVRNVLNQPLKRPPSA